MKPVRGVLDVNEVLLEAVHVRSVADRVRIDVMAAHQKSVGEAVLVIHFQRVIARTRPHVLQRYVVEGRVRPRAGAHRGGKNRTAICQSGDWIDEVDVV